MRAHMDVTSIVEDWIVPIAAYAASKFAVRVLAEGLRQEVKADNIQYRKRSPWIGDV